MLDGEKELHSRLAEPIRAYMQKHQMSPEVLADWLGLTPRQLIRLELCRVPGYTLERNKEADIDLLAETFQIDRTKLQKMLDSEANRV